MLDSILLRIAKSSILANFNDDYKIDKKKLLNEYSFLNNYRASFVTLHYDKELRGCIGSIVAHTILLEDVIHNAYSCAFRDPRFNTLSMNEFSHLTLEVSVLSEPKLLQYNNFEDLCEKIRPNVDGIILKHNSHQGTFLPQVWEQLPDPKSFLGHLSIKAGSNSHIYNEHPLIYTYGVESIETKFDDIELL